MPVILESSYFIVEAADRPHVDRSDGGHIRILPKLRVRSRTDLSPESAFELIRLSMLIGEAMKIALPRRGIDIGRINYQENGNWGVFKPEGPYLHLHIYSRARSAAHQPFGEALYLPKRDTGFYDSFQPLTEGDIKELRREILRLAASTEDLELNHPSDQKT